MAKARRIAPTITVSNLSKALSKASALASREYGVKVGRETVVLEGGFFGKVLEPSPGSDVDPMTVAAAISRRIGPGGRRVPGTIAWPTPNWPEGPILVGFWDPPPRFFNF
jgi:hypothetical protein